METQDAKRTKTEQPGTNPAPTAVDDAAQPKDTAAPAAAPDQAPISLRPLMVQYYRRLFPAQQMFKWLCYGNDSGHAAADGSFASRRELCFTLEGDIFVRYQSYQNAADLAADLARKVPTKIDIGPVYTHDPRQRAKYAKDFRPVQRELVIDIDISDYDELRTCGSGGHMCSRCWPFMAVAIQVLDAALRQDFGFQHLLWVYSEARLLADDVRAATVGYLSVIKGAEGGITKLSIPKLHLHPALQRAYDMLQAAWLQRVLPEQELLDDAAHYQAVLRHVPDEGIVNRLTQRWGAGGQGTVHANRRASAAAAGGDSCSPSVRRWDELVQEVTDEANRLRSNKATYKAMDLEKCLQDIVFAYTYPRLDAEVSKKMNHLLKAPFCVHPKTGKVCVPIDPEAAWDFDPDNVPTVQQLVQELAEQQQAAGGDGSGVARAPSSSGEGWKGTTMEAHINYFADSFLAPLTASSRAALNAQAKQAAADQRGHYDMSW